MYKAMLNRQTHSSNHEIIHEVQSMQGGEAGRVQKAVQLREMEYGSAAAEQNNFRDDNLTSL